MRHQLPFALLLASSAVACVDSGATLEDTTSVASAIEQPNAGLTTDSEKPMFDEQAEFDAAQIEQDSDVPDTMASDADVQMIASSPTSAKHRIAIVWGQMPPDRNAAAHDWSGALVVSRGAIVVGRKIGFEERDHLEPRASRDRIDFVSVTKPFVDGLALRLLDPDPASTAGGLTLTYAPATPAGSTVKIAPTVFDLGQLASGPISADMGDGNSMVVTALREQDMCEHGFLRGRWHELRAGLGAYRGLITNEAGEVTGHIKGVWGQRKNGDKVMFGKFIALDGSFRGLVAGTYDAGEFHARWLTQDGDRGALEGRAKAGPDSAGGVFIGRWADSSCAK